MNTKEMRRYEMFTRVRDFGSVHTEAFPAASIGGKQFKALATVIADLDEHSVAQASGQSAAKQSVTGKAQARDNLRDALTAINRNARVIELDSPGFADKFRVPPRTSDQALINAARTIAADALPVTAAFTKNEMPDDFLAQLNNRIAELEDSMTSKNISRESQVAATAAIETALDKGNKAVLQLNAIVRNKFGDDPSMMAEWERATHVEPTKRRSTAPNPPAPQS